MNAPTEKPLFIPLAGKYYDAFEIGTKTHEYRAYGPRWNERTCRPGRQAILSRGYGRQRRMVRRIVSAAIVPPSADFLAIYGEGKQCFAIELA